MGSTGNGQITKAIAPDDTIYDGRMHGGSLNLLRVKALHEEKLLVNQIRISIGLETENLRQILLGPWGNGLLGTMASAQPSNAPG
jgi:hypothetical protein